MGVETLSLLPGTFALKIILNYFYLHFNLKYYFVFVTAKIENLNIVLFWFGIFDSEEEENKNMHTCIYF